MTFLNSKLYSEMFSLIKLLSFFRLSALWCISALQDLPDVRRIVKIVHSDLLTRTILCRDHKAPKKWSELILSGMCVSEFLALDDVLKSRPLTSHMYVLCSESKVSDFLVAGSTLHQTSQAFDLLSKCHWKTFKKLLIQQ